MVRVYRETGQSEGNLIRSDEDLVDYTSADVREALVAPFMQVGEPILIQAHEPENGGMYVPERDFVSSSSNGELVGLAEALAALYVTARHPDDKAVLVVIAARRRSDQVVVERRSAHL